MKSIKISLFFLSLSLSSSLFCAQPAPDQSFPVYYNTGTKIITGPNREAINKFNALLDSQKDPEIKPSSNFLSGIKQYAFGTHLKNVEQSKRNSLYGVLLGINMIDAFQACINRGTPDVNLLNQEVPDATIAALNSLTQEVLGDQRTQTGPYAQNISLSELLKKIKITAKDRDGRVNKALFEYISEKIQQMAYNGQSSTLNQDPEANFSKEFNKHSTIKNRLLENKSTFKDRCYLKITKALFSVADWVRTKVFNKPGLQKGDGNTLYDILKFENVNADYISRLAKITYNNAKDLVNLTETFFQEKPIFDDDLNYDFFINKKTIKIDNQNYDIFSTIIQQDLGNHIATHDYSSVTQIIRDQTGNEISHTFKINYANDTAPSILAQKIITQSLESLNRQATISSPEQVLTLLKENIISNNPTIKDSTKHIFLTDSSIQSFNSSDIKSAAPVIKIDNNNIKNAIIMEEFNAKDFDFDSITSTVDSAVSIDSKTPSQTENSPEDQKSADAISIESEKFLDALDTMPGNDQQKNTIVELAAKELILKESLENLTIENIKNNNITFNFDEAVKDNEYTKNIMDHLDNLNTKATTLSDRIAIQDYISRLNTAFANRAPELSEEKKREYNKLKGELNKFIDAGLLETNKEFYNWAQNLYDTDINKFNLIKNDIDSTVFKENIKLYNGQLATDLTIDELIKLKNIFGDFIMGAENYGYGTLEFLNKPATSHEEKNYQDILIKAGINSPEQQQQLFDNLITIDKKLQDMLLDEYNKQDWHTSAKNAFIRTLTYGALTHDDYVNAFNALSNESKINFINNLPNDTNDLIPKQRNDAISIALQKTIDDATTDDAILTLQKEMFARGHVVLQSLQEKIKKVITDKYKIFTDNQSFDKNNFKLSMLNLQDFTDYSRAFKILSLSDQKSIAADLEINDNELKKFQKSLLADKIFYVKTIDELNALKADINKFNNADDTYFTNQDLGGKHGLTLIGTAFTQKTEDLILKKIHNNALFTDTQNGTDYFVNSLLDFKSQDPYASAFRQLSLLKQNEIAQTLNLQDSNASKDLTTFKKFITKALTDQANMLTDPRDLAYLLNDAENLLEAKIIEKNTFDSINARSNQAENNKAIRIEPTSRTVTFNQNGFVPDVAPSSAGQDVKPVDPRTPTAADIKTQFESQTLRKDFSVDDMATQEEKEKQEAEFRREQIAQETERAAQEKAAEEAHPSDRSVDHTTE